MKRIKKILGFIIHFCIILYYRAMHVSIGKNVFISHTAKIDTTFPDSIIIEDGVFITYGAAILAHDHSVYRHIPFSEDDGHGKVRLEENCFIGARAIVLRNVTIGKNSIVASGSVVTKNVPENTIVSGNPARVIRTFSPKDNP